MTTALDIAAMLRTQSAASRVLLTELRKRLDRQVGLEAVRTSREACDTKTVVQCENCYGSRLLGERCSVCDWRQS